MKEIIYLNTNRYVAGDEIDAIKATVEEKRGDTLILEAGGKKFCIKKIDKLLFYFVKNRIFTLVLLVLFAMTFRWSFIGGLLAAGAGYAFFKNIDRIDRAVYNKALAVLSAAAVGTVLAAVAFNLDVPPSVTSWLIFVLAYAFAFTVVLRDYATYNEIYVFCSSAAKEDGWFGVLGYFLSPPKFYFWR